MALQVGVIGGSGFIGTWLVEALRRLGHRATIIDLARTGFKPAYALRDALIETIRHEFASPAGSASLASETSSAGRPR